MTIKIEFPADRTDIALAIGQALTAIGQGKALVNSPAPTTAAANVVVMAGKEGAPVETGPFYWLHHESESYGTVETRAELEAMIDSGDGLVNEASKEHYDETTAAWEQAAADNVAAETFGNTAGKQEPSTATQGADGAPAAQGDGAKRDEKGVAFNGEFCSKAAIPFYGSGKKKGHWTTRQGVDEGAYDDWYADELFSGKIEDSGQEQANETTSDSNVATNTFGNNTAANTQTDEATPQDAGQLMKWVSEQQAASNITQQQVTDAYTALQLPFDAVMNPAYPVADNCAAIYNHLKGQI